MAEDILQQAVDCNKRWNKQQAKKLQLVLKRQRIK